MILQWRISGEAKCKAKWSPWYTAATGANYLDGPVRKMIEAINATSPSEGRMSSGGGRLAKVTLNRNCGDRIQYRLKEA